MENPKELAKKIEEAVGELHKAVERQDAEIAKHGQPLAETKATVERIDKALTALMEQKATLDKRLDDIELKMERGKLVKPGDGDRTPEQKAQKDVSISHRARTRC